ncbi:hypothetical protein [Novosphingobium rosa]|uniref:hypothetical protein n=1 Tax=Novosphingobium rosa TaxID=76978 RepID=UPI00082F160D|nr:hypothetical protein [Novosphingobium rosa]
MHSNHHPGIHRRPKVGVGAVARAATRQHQHWVDYALVALFAALGGSLIYRAVWQAAGDGVLALLAPLVVFLVVASFFSDGGHARR